jgi:hypothetical protein
MLVGLLLSAKQNYTKITKQFILTIVNVAFATSSGFPFGMKWCKLFVKRFGHMWRFTTKKRIAEGRTSVLTFKQSILFSNVWQNILTDYQSLGLSLNPDVICNVDETLLNITANGRVFGQLDLRDGAHGDSKLKGTTIGSMIVFISASGNVPLVMFCLKKRPRQRNLMIPILPNEIATRYGSTVDVFAVDHCTTETGFIRKEQFQQGIQKFAIVMQERYPEK